MNPTPLLDFWQKPAKAGDPLAVLATTFALEPDFFEQNCLARFLEVSSVDESSGSVEDIVAQVEMQEMLQTASVTVLADRSAPVQRTSLLWDILGCEVQGGLLHAKVAVLIWQNATRVILGSANLTAAGYRRQIELGLAVDLGPQCLFPAQVLGQIADELQAYLGLVPGYAPDVQAFDRARDTLALFRQRIEAQPQVNSGLRVAFAPTNPQAAPLDQLSAAWSGSQPLQATHLSPFWDATDPAALNAARGLLTGRPASSRSQQVAVVIDPRGRIAFSPELAKVVNGVQKLKPQDKEVRTLHAKCLLIESDAWVAALVGSSNHTKAGLGLAAGRRHREMNVWIGAPRDSREGKYLRQLIVLDGKTAGDEPFIELQDEDEAEVTALPPCFGLCRLVQAQGQKATWQLQFGITETSDMPADWQIGLTSGAAAVLTRAQWQAQGSPGTTTHVLAEPAVPMFVMVRWNGHELPWAVIAEDRHCLPPLPALASLQAHHLLAALARGQSLAQALRDQLANGNAAEQKEKTDADLNPLSRFDNPESLLRKGRALAASLSAMQRRLEQPVITGDTLRARLTGPLGPEFVAGKVVQAYEDGRQGRAETIFTVAEIALTVGRVNWRKVLQNMDRAVGIALVEQTLKRLDQLRSRLGNEPADLASYANRAMKETRQCLAS